VIGTAAGVGATAGALQTPTFITASLGGGSATGNVTVPAAALMYATADGTGAATATLLQGFVASLDGTGMVGGLLATSPTKRVKITLRQLQTQRVVLQSPRGIW
jgi:hypothetical protein